MSARKKRIAAIVLAGAMALGTVANDVSTAFASGPSVKTGRVTVAGKLWRNVPYVTVGGTTYFGIWYLQQLLRDYGIDSVWDGKNLYLPSIPSLVSPATTTVNGKAAGGTTLSYLGSHYIDVTALASAVGGSAQYDAAAKLLNLTLPAGTSATAVVTSRPPTSGAHLLTVPHSATSTTKLLTASHTATVTTGAYILENGYLWKQVPIVRVSGTTYIGTWYVQQYLRSKGIIATWDGRQLSISMLPHVIPGVSVRLADMQRTVTLIQLGAHWYASDADLKWLGLDVAANSSGTSVSVRYPVASSAQVSGQLVTLSGQPLKGRVAIADANGEVQVVDADASGRFTASVDTYSGTIIGTDTPGDGWIGQSIPFAGDTSNLLPNNAVTMSQINGRIAYSGKPYQITMISVRNVITHGHYYASVAKDGTFTMTVPTGAYEVFAAVTDTDAVFLLQPFTTSGSQTNLTVVAPALPAGLTYSTQHADITATDTSVSPEAIVSVADEFEHIYGPTVRATGLTPAGKMHITLYGSASSYQQHFLDEGYSAQEVQQIAQDAVATEEGTDTISVLMPAFANVDGMNVLAHEFTHALVATVSDQIPSWANEGFAWINGVNGETDQSPDQTLLSSDQWSQWLDIVDHQKQGDLLPLGDPNPLDGTYNIEAQDYYAVQMLVDQFGIDKFLAYVKAIDTDPNAFQDTFGEPFDAFAQQVAASLQQHAGQVNTSFTVRVRVLPGGPSDFYVINPQGKVTRVTGLEPGNVYAITFNQDGTINVPSGLTAAAGADLPVVFSGDWYLGTDNQGTENRQEFDIEYNYGVAFLATSILYGSDGAVEHAFPATAVPNGLQIVDIAAQ